MTKNESKKINVYDMSKKDLDKLMNDISKKIDEIEKEGDYKDNLPEEEKKAFLDEIDRRIKEIEESE